MRAVAIYPAGVSCCRFFRFSPPRRGGGRRGVIRGFSSASRKRLRSCLLSKIDPKAIGERRLLWITLTVKSGNSRYVKDVFRAAVERLRVSGIPYFLVWRLEYQKRGTPHLHVLLISQSTASVLAAARVLVSNFLRLSGASPRAQCVKFVRGFSRLALYVSDMSKVQQSNPGEDSPGRWWGCRGDFFTVVLPVLLYGSDVYFQAVRFLRSLRRARARARGRRWKGRGLLSEFFDTPRFFPYLRDICGA